MSIFDLLFLVAALVTVITLTTAGVIAWRGDGAQAFRMLRLYGFCLATYFATALAVDFFKSQRVIAAGSPWCFDDWCLQVRRLERTRIGGYESYDFALRVFSTARRVSQSAKGAWIYLVDEQGRRYLPNADPSGVPLSVRLGPEQSVNLSRVFAVPIGSNARILGLITGHGGPYCGPMSVLIIGAGGCLFNRPTMIRVD